MTVDTKMHVEISGNDTIFTRIINAPRTLIFKAWTYPKHLANLKVRPDYPVAPLTM